MTSTETDKPAKGLISSSLEVENYRIFKHLIIPQFGRVNLIVGKNNVGKSTLLEALWLYTQRGYAPVLVDLLRSRDEYSRVSRFSEESKERMWDIKNLFYGRRDIKDECPTIRIGPIDSLMEKLLIDIKWYVSETDEQGFVDRKLASDPSKRSEADPFVVTRFGNRNGRLVRLDRLMERRFTPPLSTDVQKTPGQFVKANGLDADDVAQLWDNIALKDLEDSVIEALHIIAPEVRRISFLGNKEASEKRVPVARVDELAEPIPIRSMGEGMNRILGMALALVNAQDGVLLVDEIESGLHYTVQPDIWRLIFSIAHRLNVQVFATTHGWDCVEAFQKAAKEDSKDDGFLIRLERRDGEIGVTLFDERKLTIATKEQIEVR